MAKKNKNTGFNLAGANKKFGFRTIPNESVQWRLQTADGKYFGDVSYDAYKAVESGTLDSYKAKNTKEKNIIDQYKEFVDNLTVDFKLSDGTNLGKISKKGLDAISNDTLHTYVPKNDAEKATIDNYKEIANYVHPDKRVEGDSFSAHTKHTGEQAGWSLKSVWNGIKSTFMDGVARSFEQPDSTLLAAESMGLVEDGFNDRYSAEMQKSADAIREGIQSSYEALAKEKALIPNKYPDLNEKGRKMGEWIGGAAQVVPMAVGSAVSPYLGTTILGAQVYGNSMGEALSEGASVDAASTYALLDTSKEIAYERLVGGIPFIGGVTDDLVKAVANKVTSKLFSNASKNLFTKVASVATKYGIKTAWNGAGEGIEEFLATYTSPFIKRAVYDKDAPLATAEELSDAFMGGAVASVLLGTANDIGVGIVTKKQLPTNIAKFNELIDVLPEQIRPAKLSENATLDEYNAAVARVVSDVEISQLSAEKTANSAMVKHIETEIEKLRSSDIITKENQDLINEYSSYLETLNNSAVTIDAAIGELGAIKNGTANSKTISKYIESHQYTGVHLSENIQNAVDKLTNRTAEHYKYGADMSRIYRVNSRMMQSSDSVVDAVIVKEYIDTFVNMIASNKSRAYQLLSNEGINISQALYDYVVSGEIPSNLTNSAVFSKTADALKNMLVASFGDLASAHSSIYGVDTALNAQLDSIQNGDFSFLAGKYLGETARALPEGNSSVKKNPAANTEGQRIYNGAENASVPEIVTLKKERSIYTVFRDAKTIYKGVDCLTDKKVVVPKSDEAIEGISAVTDAAIEATDKYNLARVYDKTNSVVIEGEPKVGANGTYIFEIDGKFYACRQKHLDAFNNGKRIIKANTNEKTGWTVHNENGKLIACFMPVKTDSITEEMYNSLPYVSEVMAKETSSDKTSTKELKNQVDNDTIISNEKTVNEVDTEAQNKLPHKEGIAYTNDNQEIKFRYKVIDISDVVASNDTEGKINPDYPAELQPRDRQRGASISQVMDIASNLNPARMTESNSVSEGAPIVGFDNVVESGNGRTMALALAYDKYADKASEYKQYLIDHAEDFGIDVNSLPERPILVRERITEVDRAEFARKANESNISSHNSTDQAKIDAERITDKAFSMLKYNDDGEINLFSKDNKPFIDEMVSNVFGKNDLNNLVTADGMLSANGVSRVENALFYKAYGDTTLTALLSERTDNPMKNIVKALLNVSPRAAFISNGIEQGLFYDFDFSGDIVSAAKLLYDLKEDGTKLEAYIGQQSLYEKETKEAQKIVEFLDQNTRSAKRCTEFLKDILNEVQDMGSPDQISLFGNETQKSKGEIIDGVISRRNTENDTRGIGKTGQYDIGSSGETVEPDARLSQGDGRSEEGSAVEGNKSVESDNKTRTRGNSTRSDTEVSEGRKRGQKETVRENDSRTEKNSEQGIETPSNTKAKRSSSSKSSKNKLEDFGEKIGGAKKDLWRTRGLMGEDISEMSEYDKQKYIKKDNIWRKPDYDNMIESGVPAEVVYFVKKVRDNLPTAPSYSTTYTPERIAEIRESYINGVREVMDYAMSLKTVDDAKKMLEDFFVDRGYVEKGNYGYLSATEKYQQNNALYQKPNLVNFTAKAARNWEYNIVKPMKKDQFGVSKDEKIPKGYEIRELNNGEVAVVKGYRIVQGGFATNADAIKWAQENLNTTSVGKKRFTPPQLSSIHRQGPDYRENNTKDVAGQDYLETFKFRGGEFGNWMNESDRQTSMNYGFDALMDLAVALNVLPEDISLGGKLAIAFGARGQAGAVAHFEPGSNVINLTKMKGAGSLAHEWGHGFDFFLANVLGSKSTFLTDAGGKTSDDSLQGIMSKLVNTMKYREMTADEEAARQTANKESNQRKAAAWVDYAFKGITNKFTEEQQSKFNQLKEEYLQGWDQEGPFEITDKFSALHKEVTGRVIPKETRNNITSWYRIIGYSGGQSTVKGRVKTDFYTNSIEMDKRYSKSDKGYWQSDVEMFARAFACYVKDKIPGRSDYLVGHAQCNSYMEEDGTLKAAFPVGKEREAINAVFDELIAKAKEEGYLHHAEHKTDTYNTVRYSIESEADYGEGNNILDGSKQRNVGERSGKQTRRVDKGSRRGKEKSIQERQEFLRGLESNQKEEKILTDSEGRKNKLTVVKKSAWNDHMKHIASYYEAHGVSVEFVDGDISFAFDGEKHLARGMRYGDTIYVSYNNRRFSPEQIAEHEFIHNKYTTDEVQEAKKQILEKMSEEEYNKVTEKIKEAYSGIATKSEIEEELICNILSGMYENSSEYADIVNTYWSKAESDVSGYDVSQYADSIDAGGKRDAAYLDAVKKGDIETAQRMVDEAAKKWGALTDENGNVVYAYRGDSQKGKTVFNPGEYHDRLIFTSTSESVGNAYKGDGSVYKFYIKEDGLLEIEGNYGVAQDILIPEELSSVNTENRAKATVNEIGVMAREAGYKGVYVKNIRDGSGFVWADDVVLFEGGSQMKTAEPVTYDDNGNIIPLSKRFDEGAPDIRYSVNSDESGETNESRNTQELGKQGISENNDSVWQRSDDSKGVYERLGVGEKRIQRSQEKGNRLIDWGGKFRDLDVYESREKEYAYGVLRKISQLKISSQDSDGRKLSEKQKNFFADTVAKNSKGELFTLYHATDNEFDEFLYGDFGFHVGTLGQALRVNNKGKKYLKEVYVNITNPVFISEDTMHWPGFAVAAKLEEQGLISSSDYETLSKLDGFWDNVYDSDANKEIRRMLKDEGYDGIVYNNGFEGDGISFMAFDSNQIKYTSNTNPTDGPKLSYSLADDGEYDFGDIWDETVETYGAIPKGEKPAREVSVPKKISDTEPVSYFARTMMEAGVTPDEALSEFEQAILDGTMSHEVITDKETLKKVQDKIKHEGFEGAMNIWSTLTKEGKIGKRELALGMELYNQCVNNKDYKNAMKIAAELAAEATRAGQTLQACRLLKQMSPDGQLYYLEKSVAKMNEEFREKLGKKFEDIELDEDLMQEFFESEDEAKRNEAYDKICQHIAEQIPATWVDKWNSWRYLAMLGNPRTHIRNIIGNAVFTPAIRIKNYIGAIGERIAKVDTSERTKSFKKTKAAVEFAKSDFNEMIKVLQGVNAKYAVTSDIDSKRQIFKTKALEKLRTKNFEFLEMEDMWFLKTHYVDALARIITARELDVTDIDTDTLDKIRAYAVKEAQAATYRDANALAEGLNKLQRKAEMSRNKAVRATGVLVEGVMPFKKTPLNIAKQGVLYSPMSILTGTYQLLKGVKEGTHTTSDAIDTLAKGLTGTGLMLLGFLLAQLGILVGEEEEPDKKKKYDKALGEQSYSIKIGDSSYTIDWAAPLNLSLFTGSALYEVTKDSEFTFKKVVDSLATLPEPLLELSVFSGISDIISSAQYEDTNPVTPIVTNMATNYLTQALPTIGGQVSRIIDSTKRNYYYEDKNSDIPGGLQNLIGKTASKIPFASKLFEPYVDVWGRVENYGGVVERTAENFVSPGYYSEEKYTAVDKELQRLFERTGETDVLPRTQQKYFTSDGVKYDMTAEQYTEAKVLRGRKSFELVNKLINSSKYKNMSDENKIKAIRKCYDEAGDYTKEQMIDKVKGNGKK